MPAPPSPRKSANPKLRSCGGDGSCRQDWAHQVYRCGYEFFGGYTFGRVDPLLCGTVDGPTCRGGDEVGIVGAFHWMFLVAVHQDDANLVDYRALDKGFELALFGGAGFLQFGEIVTNGQNDRVKGCGAGPVKAPGYPFLPGLYVVLTSLIAIDASRMM